MNKSGNSKSDEHRAAPAGGELCGWEAEASGNLSQVVVPRRFKIIGTTEIGN